MSPIWKGTAAALLAAALLSGCASGRSDTNGESGTASAPPDGFGAGIFGGEPGAAGRRRGQDLPLRPEVDVGRAAAEMGRTGRHDQKRTRCTYPEPISKARSRSI
ncbi:hypothetical protein [Cohnella rhizosphaerae]|uniref:Lipoprotein n=1 Tax=Cohnella rhizosphaerae TaxID=1457232 RepID=A0A9X4KR67_9BACL|nr:hypothetical protein [Cohnella rhizosphaerae]MDG0808711.1 hypothetical protein [Cohnella rhizosphaerae]